MVDKRTSEHQGPFAEYESTEVAGSQSWETSRHSILNSTVRRCDYFGDDTTDEFRITREDGTEQGIFKVWAAPVIPILDTKNLNVAEALATWSDELAKKPLSLYESLDQWRSYSALTDRRLQQVFAERSLPEEPAAATAELFNRLSVAFAHSAPFYNLEALIADSRDSQDRRDNPIDFDEENAAGGKLDAVAMMLPSAFQNYVQADRLEWNGLSWEQLHQDTETLRQNFLDETDPQSVQQYTLLSKIAHQANIEPATVLFAANLLQFIPADVGGKREDLSQDDAMTTLVHLFEQPQGNITTGAVAKDVNALIRFLNWSPAIKSNDNFNGAGMAYDAVCATAAQLVDIVQAHPDVVFTPNFAPVFTEQLAPQLNGLDAASAKGRFMLQLLQEGKLQPDITGAIASQAEQFDTEITTSLDTLASQEKVLNIADLSSTYLVGGKATGLRKAIELFGAEKVVGGHVVTSEAITAWLQNIEGVGQLIDAFADAQTIDDKIAIGQLITEAIHQSPPDLQLIAHIQNAATDMHRIVLRSSSYDEDVDLIGPAPGVYESAIDIDPTDTIAVSAGLKESVTSFFSDKAISFRELKGLRHHPLFAVLVQEFIPGAGGSFFVQDGAIALNIAPSPSQINGLDKRDLIEDFSLSTADRVTNASALLSDTHIHEILRLARHAETVFGPTDIEFVIDPRTDNLKLLQLRSLERPPVSAAHHEQAMNITAVPIDTLDELPIIDDLEFVDLHINDAIDLEKFQGALFRWIITHREKVRSITLTEAIPKTCHFANIIESLGIRIQSQHN